MISLVYRVLNDCQMRVRPGEGKLASYLYIHACSVGHTCMVTFPHGSEIMVLVVVEEDLQVQVEWTGLASTRPAKLRGGLPS